MSDGATAGGVESAARSAPKQRLDLYRRRDARQIRRQAQEIIRQVNALERHLDEGHHNDTLRFLLIRALTRNLLKAAKRPARRYEREHPWP
jgi:hypothetical protein